MQAMASELDDCNVFVKYLPPELSESDFHKMFKQYGTIISSKIMVDQSGKSLGYGFVRFSTPEFSNQAIAAMNGRKVANKRLLCKLANQSPSSSYNAEFTKNPLLRQQLPSDNVFVKPLLLTTTEEDLRRLFGTFGKITECKVMVDKNTGISHQIGFVRFETTDQAKEAIQAMNNYKLTPTSPPLVVKYADTKEQKDARKIFRQKNPVENEEPSGYSSPVYYYSPSQYAFVYPPSYYEMPDAYIGSPGDGLYGSPYTQPTYFPPQPYFFEAPHMYPGAYGSPYGSPGHAYSAPYEPEEYPGVFFSRRI